MCGGFFKGGGEDRESGRLWFDLEVFPPLLTLVNFVKDQMGIGVWLSF